MNYLKNEIMENRVMLEKDWKMLLNKIEAYTQKKLNRLSDVYSDALTVFSNIPNVTTASIFILEGELLDFELKTFYPNNAKDLILELYNSNIDNGNIGKVLQNGVMNCYDYQNDKINAKTIVIIPLKSSTKFIGMVLLTSNKICSINEIHTLCSLFGNLISNQIQQNRMFNDLAISKSLLEQKVAAETMDLAQSKRELKAIFDSVLTGIIVYDTQTNLIINANPVAIDLLQTFEQDISQYYISEFLPSFHQAKDLELNTTLFEPSESELMDCNGNKIPILRNAIFINLGTKRVGIESILDNTHRKNAEIALRDSNRILELKVMERTEDLQLLVEKLKTEIKERELAEKEVRRMLEQEKELSIMKSKFVSMVSHEFRTPLTVIKSSAQMIEKFRGNLSLEEISFLNNKIMKTVDNMTDLIENVIFIGKSESKTMRINGTPINLIEFCENIIKDIKIGFGPLREVSFSLFGEYKKINIDEKLLRLILYNLLSNALKYSENNKPVNFYVTIEQKNIILVVEDFGIGIPESEHENIFGLFYRANNVGNISGTGLGLSVVIESIEKLNGKIDFWSKENQGTKFTIVIPIETNGN